MTSTTDARESRNTIIVERWPAGPLRAIQPRFARARETRAGRSERCADAEESSPYDLSEDDPALPVPDGEDEVETEEDVDGDDVDGAVPSPAVEPGELVVDVDGAEGAAGRATGELGVVGAEGVCGTVGVASVTVGRVGTLTVGGGGRSMPGASAA